jgi:hypothetical protein
LITDAHTVDASKPRRAKQVYVVLPAYNEEARIGNLLDHIDEEMDEESKRAMRLVSFVRGV